MAYTKTVFVNGGAPGISQIELNKIGDGISDAHDAAAVVSADLATHEGLFTNPHQVTAMQSFSKVGEILVGAGTGRWKLLSAITIIDIVATCGTAPTGDDVIIDVNKDGTTLFTTQANRPKVAAGSNDGSSTTPNTTVCAAGSVITVDIDQVGSTIRGFNLTVTIRYRETD